MINPPHNQASLSQHIFTFRGMTLCYDIEKHILSAWEKDLQVAIPEEGDLTARVEKNDNNIKTEQSIDYEVLAKRFFHHRPRRIQVNVSRLCNLACRYCYSIHDSNRNPAHSFMDAQTAAETVRFFLNRAGDRDNLTISFIGGGEPLLNFDMIKIFVSLLTPEKKQFHFQVVTNGILLSRNDIRNFLLKNRFQVIISIDGYQQMHNRYRVFPSGEGSFKTVMENALLLRKEYEKKELSPKIGIRATMTREYDNPFTIRNHLRKAGFDRQVVSADQESLMFDNSGTCFTQKNWDNMFERTLSLMKNDLSKIEHRKRLSRYEKECMELWGKWPPRKKHNILGGHCGVGRNALAVDTDGRIYPCHRYLGVSNYGMGDADKGILYENMLRFFSQAAVLYEKNCRSCWVRYLCHGPCIWTLSRPDGSIMDLPRNFCMMTKREIERNMWFYFSLKSMKNR